MTCSWCSNEAYVRGVCQAHYSAHLRGTFDIDTGEDRRRRPLPSDLADRLSDRLEVADCWTWTGTRDPAGYGRVSWSRGSSSRLAHRWIYEALVGPIPEGMQLDHLCRNRACCNPDHLEVVIPRENTRRGSQDFSSGPCKHGHAAHYRRFAPSQTYCLMCRNLRKVKR